MRHPSRWSWLLVAALGCGGQDEAQLAIPEGCNPLGYPHDCMLPYPSDYFRVSDPELPAGARVRLSDAAMLVTEDGKTVDMLALHPADGFSPGTQILALFAEELDGEPLVGASDDATASLDPASPTVLLEADTGRRILHLAELDPRATDDARRALVIRPLERLGDATRYIVAVRGLRTRTGEPVQPPPAFAALRDGTAEPALAGLAARYPGEVFAPLEAAGVARADLQLAWDFTTRSRENLMGDMLAVRAGVMESFDASPPAVTVLEVLDQPEPHQHRRIEARIEVPRFVESAEPMARLTRDESGKVVASGKVEVPFTILVPDSVANRPAGAAPARLMQFGHGFFGGRSEIHGFIDQLADERGFVVVAADWWGMSEEDRLVLGEAILSEPEAALVFTDRVHQAMANFIAVACAATGSLAQLPELQIGAPPLFDDSALYFYGLSQGHILGGTYLALSPEIERGVLGVGGAGFSLMMFRARPFVAFLALLQLHFPDTLDQQKIVVLMQSSFDRIDPLTYAPLVRSTPLDDGPATRQLLLQIGIGDTAVPNLAAHVHARALGLTLLEPAPRPIAGLPAASGPLDSALVEFDFGIDPLPGIEAIPPTADNEVHEGVRRLDAAKEQLDRFLRPDGRVEPTCDGPCDPE